MVFLSRLAPLLFAAPPRTYTTTTNYSPISARTTTFLHSATASSSSIDTDILNNNDDAIVENKIPTDIDSNSNSNEEDSSQTISTLSSTNSKESNVNDDIEEEFTSFVQVSNYMKDLYSDLSNPQSYTVNYSPTIAFAHVPDPSTTSTHSWRGTPITPTTASTQDKESIYQTTNSLHQNTKPLLIYLPGLDGVGISATQQYDSLATQFELWRMVIDPKLDRSSFTDLTRIVSDFILDVINNSASNDRQVILVGESFGGLLATSVALRLQGIQKRRAKQSSTSDEMSILKGMVLVNPATSFDETAWDIFGPLLSSLRYLEGANKDDGSNEGGDSAFPTPYSVIGGLALSAVIPDSTQLQSIISTYTNAASNIKSIDDVSQIFQAMSDGFGILADQLPAEVVEHRVSQWLPVGCEVVNPRLGTLEVPTLVIAGEDDNMLPTKEEAERLVTTMPNCTSMMIKGSGHFVLDERVNLTKAVLDAHFSDAFKRQKDKVYDPILDWELPDEEVFQRTLERQVQPFRTITSPVFFSTGSDKKRRLGLGQIPQPSEERSILFVANHQFFGLDLGMIISQLLEERNITARGLAHPVIFQGSSGGGGGGGFDQRTPDEPVIRDKDGPLPEMGIFQKFGAVMVTPRNFYRLMETKQNGLLFPGGVREVFHGKDEAYKLFWPEKVDFIRTAAKWNATIVPLSAVGAADSVNIYIDGPDMLQLTNSTSRNAKTTAARYDSDNADELFQPPFFLPKVPARQYFVFGQPYDTTGLDPRDKIGCEKAYKEVKAELERGLNDVIKARNDDPFADTGRRIAYEQVTGKAAPTFPVVNLNK